MNKLRGLVSGTLCVGLLSSALVFANSGSAQGSGSPDFGKSKLSQGKGEITTSKKVILQKKTEFPTVQIQQNRADLNRMEVRHFEVLGVPPELSKSIVDYRASNGPFKRNEDL